jgi:hypothetical protein
MDPLRVLPELGLYLACSQAAQKKNNHAHIVSCFMPVSKNRLYAVFKKKIT